MAERIKNLEVGDRVQLSPNLPGYLVVDVRYAKQGAIGIVGDLPEHKEAVRKALEAFAAAVREDQWRPREASPRRPWYFDQPLD